MNEEPALPNSNLVTEKLLGEAMLAIARMSATVERTNASIAHSRQVIEHGEGTVTPEPRPGTSGALAAPAQPPHPID